MPRLSRIDAPGLLQHVIVRGIEKRDIFIDDEDRRDIIRRMAKLLPETGMECFAWALLTNHFHLLLRPLQKPLATFMRRLLTGYAVYFNRRHKRSGHLYQNRYKSIVCERETYFLELVRYIHLNPLRAGMVKNLDELDVYPWSGHATLVGNEKLPWQECNEILSFFGDSVGNYRLFIMERIESGDISDHKNPASSIKCSGQVLGSKEFAESFEHVEKKSLKPNLKAQDAFQLILKTTLQHYGLEEESILSGSKSSAISCCRAVIAYLAQVRSGMMGTDIAEKLGLSRSAVSRLVQRGRKIACQEKPLLEKIESNNL